MAGAPPNLFAVKTAPAEDPVPVTEQTIEVAEDPIPEQQTMDGSETFLLCRNICAQEKLRPDLDLGRASCKDVRDWLVENDTDYPHCCCRLIFPACAIGCYEGPCNTKNSLAMFHPCCLVFGFVFTFCCWSPVPRNPEIRQKLEEHFGGKPEQVSMDSKGQGVSSPAPAQSDETCSGLFCCWRGSRG